jgi:hypothetical protein
MFNKKTRPEGFGAAFGLTDGTHFLLRSALVIALLVRLDDYQAAAFFGS